MKKLIAVVLVFMLAVSVTPVFAAKGSKGASEKAYAHASEDSVFNRVGDWFATRGKSEEEKDKILAERRTERAAKRAQKAAEKKKAEKETEKKKKEAGEKVKKMKKGS